MIVTLGHLSLWIAACMSLIMWGLWPRKQEMSKSTPLIETLTILQFAMVFFSFSALTYAFVTSDYSVASVALNSNHLMPIMYRFSAVWGNHEGSMLLWVLLFTAYSAAYALMKPNPLKRETLLWQSFIIFFFLLYLILIANPFDQLEVIPRMGMGLNPLLEDPALSIHPPFLFAGYVGFGFLFSYALAILHHKKYSKGYFLDLRRWTLVPWMFLSIGITLGSFWAYYELGWGGWWFWDPVENVSLMPWLAATVLLHVLSVSKNTGHLKRSSLLLALIPFLLSVFGAFIVRSGILTSVHAFAVDPLNGIYLFCALMIFMVIGLTIWFRNAGAFEGRGLLKLNSREGIMSMGSLLILTMLGVVFIGTVYPLVLDYIIDEQIVVGAPFFNTTLMPIAFGILILMAIAPRFDDQVLKAQLLMGAVVFMGSMLTSLYLYSDGPFVAHIALAMAVWMMIAMFMGMKINSMTLAHVGFGIAIACMSIDVLGQQEVVQIVPIGKTINVGGQSVTLESVHQRQGPYFKQEVATLKVNGESVLLPERRFYPLHEAITTETALLTKGISQLYAALGDYKGNDRWTLRLTWHPFVLGIWLGGLLMGSGGLWGLVTRQRRLLVLLLLIALPQENLLAAKDRVSILAQQILCPTCAGQSVDESSTAAAREIKLLIMARIAEGKTDKEILNEVEKRYGTNVLTRPPFHLSTMLLWLSPMVILGMTGACIWWRRHK
jgi:cytochrome c-type biogenesis protein CcmF